MKYEELSIPKSEKLDLVQLKEKVLTWLSVHVSVSRVKHILRVEKMAQELANYYAINQEKAQLAALMHDLAKYFSPQVLLQIAKSEGLEIDLVSEVSPHLLHANVSELWPKKNLASRIRRF